MRHITRREWLKLMADAAVGLGAGAALSSCSPHGRTTAQLPKSTLSPSPLQTMCSEQSAIASAQVAAIKGTDLDLMTRKALFSIGGIKSVVHEGETVFIKPNMVTLPWANWRDPFIRGECTKVEVIVAVADECLKAGASAVTIGDGSQKPRFDWSLATTLDGQTNLAHEAARLSAKYNRPVKLACLEIDTPKWIEVPSGTSLKSLAISSLVMDADRVISIAVAKTHKWAHFTFSLKNAIGITPLKRYGWTNGGNYSRNALHMHDRGPDKFARLYFDLNKAIKPDLGIIEFSIGMEGDGPSSNVGGISVDMKKRLGSWLVLASKDLVAADATAARVLGNEKPFVDQILSTAMAEGMGTVCESSITMVGEKLSDIRVPWRKAKITHWL